MSPMVTTTGILMNAATQDVTKDTDRLEKEWKELFKKFEVWNPEGVPKEEKEQEEREEPLALEIIAGRIQKAMLQVLVTVKLPKEIMEGNFGRDENRCEYSRDSGACIVGS